MDDKAIDKFLVGMLTIMFVELKLTNQIDWCWWWVLSPLWIYPALCLAAYLGGRLARVFHEWSIKRKLRKDKDE